MALQDRVTTLYLTKRKRVKAHRAHVSNKKGERDGRYLHYWVGSNPSSVKKSGVGGFHTVTRARSGRSKDGWIKNREKFTATVSKVAMFYEGIGVLVKEG